MEEEIIYLCNIPQGSKIFILPPLKISDESTFMIFDLLDEGMARCITENQSVVYMPTTTPLIPKDDGYVIDRSKK